MRLRCLEWLESTPKWRTLLNQGGGIAALIIAWCELRQGFRIFRLERIRTLSFLNEPYPESPSNLRARYFAELETAEKPSD